MLQDSLFIVLILVVVEDVLVPSQKYATMAELLTVLILVVVEDVLVPQLKNLTNFQTMS